MDKVEHFKKYRLALECKLCGDVIYSQFSGHFTCCFCGAIFIDETPWYARCGYKEDGDYISHEIEVNVE